MHRLRLRSNQKSWMHCRQCRSWKQKMQLSMHEWHSESRKKWPRAQLMQVKSSAQTWQLSGQVRQVIRPSALPMPFAQIACSMHTLVTGSSTNPGLHAEHSPPGQVSQSGGQSKQISSLASKYWLWLQLTHSRPLEPEPATHLRHTPCSHVSQRLLHRRLLPTIGASRSCSGEGVL